MTPNQAPQATVRLRVRSTSRVSPAPRPLPISACAAIARASSAKAAVEKIVNATCQPASSSVPRAGRHEDRGQQRGAQRERPQEQPAARTRRPAHALALRSDRRVVAAREPADHDDVRRDHPPLRDDGSEGRSADPPAEAVDEEPVQQRVGAEAEPGDPQRGHRVLHATQEPRCSEDDEHRRQPPHRDAEIGLRVAGDLWARTEEADEQGSGEVADEGQNRADPEREPHPVDAHRHRPRRVAGAEPARDRRRGRVGEEDHEPDDRLQYGRRDAETRERSHAQVAHQRGVDDEEERLRDERSECGNGKPQDVAVQRVAAARHPPSLGAVPDAAVDPQTVWYGVCGRISCTHDRIPIWSRARRTQC